MQQLEQLNFTGQTSAFIAPINCVARRDETPDATTFIFEACNQAVFNFIPGQFITLQLEIDGHEYARSYSMSSSPSRPFTLECTVKRVEGGVVSNWLIDHLQPDMSLNALAPAGEFSLKNSKQPARYLLLSAGSGITPVMSMARWLLDTNSTAQIDFVHSSPNRENTIFQKRLEMLDEIYDNFNLNQLFSRPDNADDAQRFSAEWLNQNITDLEDTEVYVCGPTGYMKDVEAALEARGFNMDRFFKESFQPETPTENTDMNAAATFALDVEGQKTIEIKAGQSILDAVEKAGLDMAAACRAGVCGACKCQVTDGEAESSSQANLSDEDIEQGYALACSTTVSSDSRVKIG